MHSSMAVEKSYMYCIIFFSLMNCTVSASISGEIFDFCGSNGRRLLQAKKSCPINFEFMNYTVITSQCKGPRYPPDLCCQAFKQFACPYAEAINDISSDCATTMFSYINLYGKYPPGLFASECREGKLGLACPKIASEIVTNDTPAFQFVPSPIFLLLLFLFSLFFSLF